MDVFLQCKTVGLACRRSFISSKNWKGSSQWQANGKSQKTANVFLPCLWSTVAVPELYKTKVDSRLVECCFFFFLITWCYFGSDQCWPLSISSKQVSFFSVHTVV